MASWKCLPMSTAWANCELSEGNFLIDRVHALLTPHIVRGSQSSGRSSEKYNWPTSGNKRCGSTPSLKISKMASFARPSVSSKFLSRSTSRCSSAVCPMNLSMPSAMPSERFALIVLFRRITNISPEKHRLLHTMTRAPATAPHTG